MSNQLIVFASGYAAAVLILFAFLRLRTMTEEGEEQDQ